MPRRCNWLSRFFSKSKCKDKPTIKDLPAEVMELIFEYLKLEDLMVCKFVSCYWQEIVLNIRRLRLVVNHLPANRQIWYHSNNPVLNHIEMVNPVLFYSQFNNEILSNLKYLKVYIAEVDHRLSLTMYNTFTQLIHLELDYCLGDQNSKLNLSKLEVLYLAGYCQCSLFIDCPQLRVLRYHGCVSRLHLTYPESIIWLDTECYGINLNIFKNVEYLVCEKFYEIVRNTLFALEHLKEINFVSMSLFEEYRSLEFKRNVLDLLMTEKWTLGRNLKIFAYGIELPEHLSDYDLMISDIQGHMIKKYDSLADTLPFVTKIDYTQLIISLNFVIPNSFFSKFVNIQSVNVTKVFDHKRFIMFLSKLKNLKSLDLINPSLTQRFYDQLPAACSLNHFLLDEYHNVNIDYSFIAKFELLRTLRINQDLTYESFLTLTNSFSKLNHLLVLDLKVNEAFVKIKKVTKNLTVTYCIELKEDVVKCEELANYFKWLRIDTRI